MKISELKTYAPMPKHVADAYAEAVSQIQEDTVVKRKISVGLVFAIVLILLIGIAVAAGTGVFDQFAKYEGDDYLETMEQVAESYDHQTVVIEGDGHYPRAEFTLNQAYYDGQSLVVAYTLSEKWIPAELMDPAIAIDPDNDIRSERYRHDSMPYFDYVLSPEDIEMIGQTIAETGNVYVRGWSQSLRDTHVLAGDIRIDATRLNLTHMPDGTTTGYIAFDYPLPSEAQDQEELNLNFILSRSSFELYQDETGIYVKNAEDESTGILLPVVIRKNAQQGGVLLGHGAFDSYSVSAMITLSDIGAKANIAICVSEEKIHEIEGILMRSRQLGYDLLTEDGTVCPVLEHVGIQDAGQITIRMSYEVPENPGNLTLIPFYGLSGDRMDEAILMQ